MNIFTFLLGIALFLFGMNLMSEHLKKIAGSRAEVLLYRITDKPLKGVAVGTAVTALIQSSSAVSAMAMSLCESTVIKLKQAIAIILGSILGTSVTGWLIAYSSFEFSGIIANFFSPSVLSAVFASVGIVLKLFSKKRKFSRTGEILLGFAILMLGIHTIAQAVEPLKDSEGFLKAFSSFSHPLLVFLGGILLAALLQSASASVGIVQTLSLSGMITLENAYFLILGIGIGASVPVLIASVGKNADAKRAAFSYIFVNTAGAVVLGTVLYILMYVSSFNLQMRLGTVQIALLNTVYRLLLVALFTPFTSQIESLGRGLIKAKKVQLIN